VLLVDLDPQGNATMGSGVDKRQLARSVYQVLLGSATPARRSPARRPATTTCCRQSRAGGAEVDLVDLDDRERRLAQALAPLEADYDFILIDCPPSLSLLTINGLCCAHGVVIPMPVRVFRARRAHRPRHTIKRVHANLNPA